MLSSGQLLVLLWVLGKYWNIHPATAVNCPPEMLLWKEHNASLVVSQDRFPTLRHPAMLFGTDLLLYIARRCFSKLFWCSVILQNNNVCEWTVVQVHILYYNYYLIKPLKPLKWTSTSWFPGTTLSNPRLLLPNSWQSSSTNPSSLFSAWWS